jgi:Xaa-Pro aminopeptidase
MREFSPDPKPRFVDPDRLDRIRRSIDGSSLDGYIAFSPENSYYLSGTYAGMYSRPVAGLVTSEESLFFGPYLERRKAARTAWTDRGLVFEDQDDPFELLGDAVNDTGATTLGYDAAEAPPGWVDALDAATDAELVDATDRLLTLRATKTDWEIDLMRKASDLATAGMEAYLERVGSGVPEIEVVRAIQDAYYDTYLDHHPEYDIGTANELGQYGFASVLSGDHALEPHSLSSARPIADGEAVVGIALPSIQGYVCEEERTVLVGDVPSHIESAMETLVDVREQAMEKMGPGVPTADVDKETGDALRAAGYGENIIHRTGHGEGITIHEGPAMNASSPGGALEPGMVMSVEPGLYFEDDDVALRHSDTFVITESGAERLTDTPAGVHRVD